MAVQRGQIWQLGRHRLMCGDATSRDDVEALLDGVTADLTLTDPPYGAGYFRGRSNTDESFTHCGSTKTYEQVLGNESVNVARLNYEIVKGSSREQILFGGNYFTEFLPVSRCWLFWDKHAGSPNYSDGELAWTSFDRVLKE